MLQDIHNVYVVDNVYNVSTILNEYNACIVDGECSIHVVHKVYSAHDEYIYIYIYTR